MSNGATATRTPAGCETSPIRIGRGQAIHQGYKLGGRWVPVCGHSQNSAARRSPAMPIPGADVTCTRCR